LKNKKCRNAFIILIQI